jgi:glycosyltransferase involved in cell wall biosynthesis
MHLLGKIFDNYEIIIFFDKSNDNTLQKLIELAKKNTKIKFYVNPNKTTPFRTHNIANGRNFLLNYVKENKDKYNYLMIEIY